MPSRARDATTNQRPRTPARREVAPDGERTENLAQRLVAQLLDLIASASGPELVFPSERQFADELHVSRNVLREAFSALANNGVVELRGKVRVGNAARARRQLATSASERVDDDPLEARWALEPEVAALAAAHATPAALDEVERWLQLMVDALGRGGVRLVEYDSAFHVAIARAAANRTLVDLLTGLTDVLTATRELSFRSQDAGREGIAEHAEILAALRAHDPERARHAMRHHLEQVRARVREALGEDGDARSYRLSRS